MARVIQSSFVLNYDLRCLTCGREQKIVHGPVLNIGDVITPSAGHGSFGKCFSCRSEGLQVIRRSKVVSDNQLRPIWT